MQDYKHILDRLNQFIQKHYSQVLLKGILLFFALGLLFFLLILGVEYFLWMNTTGRMILFGIFIAVELFLLFKYILTPIFYLFKLKQGIGPKDAAQIIGNYFPEVGDKLTNLLDLANDPEQSELLLASINQRSKQLDPIPFSNAIDFKDCLKYLKYVIIPIAIIGLLLISGNWNSFFGTYERVVNYEMAYEKPAPFQFELLSDDLKTLQDETFTIQVATRGELKPENVYIEIDDKQILLQQNNGFYEYEFTPPLTTTNFKFMANEVNSREYTLTALETPSILDFTMNLTYPSYLNKPNETIKSTGNAVIPEGTKIQWKINGENTDKINLSTKDTILQLTKENNTFQLEKRIYNDFNYELTTTNKNVEDYERLTYNFKVIKDGYPTIKVNQVLDSLNPNVSYYTGNATDDYGLRKIDVVYFEVGKEEKKNTINLLKPTSNYEQFYYTFPSGLALEAGKNYGFYFEVTDNDAIHNGKTTKSQIYQQVLLDENQLTNKDLESQQSLIKDLDKSLQKSKEQKEYLEEINQNQKEKNSLNFNDKNQIKDYLKKQELQEQLRQKFSKELKENLNKENKDDKLNQLLQDRLERQEKQAKKNQQLLEELNKVADKIKKEDLTKKLEELGKKQQNSQRSLEQLLELTKRYYVTEKASQIARDLEELAKKQEELSEQKNENNTAEEQEKLNEQFDKISAELDDLKKDNEKLKKPIDINIDKSKKEGVKEDQKKALEELEKNNSKDHNKPTSSDANKKQKSASDKMKEMSEQLSESSSGGGGGSSVTEDAEMLRQILDNLIIFSFKQETLYDRLTAREDQDATQYSERVRDQNELKSLFEHVDDSLFALSLRQAELSEFVNEQITEVYYNIDKSLETMADGQMFQGISHQKYVLTAANSLADFLAEVMDNMNSSMQMGKGSGQSEGGFQLPDIIKGQQQLGEKMGQQGKSGSEGKQGKSGEVKQGENGENGEGGKQGERGKQGANGKEGESGSDGENGKNGEGKSGKNGINGEAGENGQGNNGSNGTNGQGQGSMSETELKEIYEIYQNQQKLRQELEKQLENMINSGDQKLGQKLIKQMEDFENDLLENGVTQRTINKANTIQYELLKLENAALKQGEKSERESNRNTKDFTNPITTKPSLLDNYRNEVEILNRQSLPLRQNFQSKVKEYFKAND
ncbi:hypothetical protein CLV90_0356 [Maribacter spongiicola]|uniref:Collagen triple helix repeat protein n=1 Tax=Maribacter spongiicola TaxID=1206753 RepID=A0A4R7K7C2_9FLAO|nr:DUF4175 family protein [Maribacter spongiicola]TDT46308.1 hypothetical protein CLV90_0356 [Maribacter spongiicola]